MSWLSDYEYSWYEAIALKVIRSGSIPRHVAFIMDGNRRFASLEHLTKIDGHSKGFDKLAQCLRWCLDVGIQEVTTFAFSIENFKRNESEVSGLLNLAIKKFRKLIAEEDKLKEHGVRIRVIGNIRLLPLELQQLVAKALLLTENNAKLFLNIAFSYTSHDELTQTVEALLWHGGDVLELADINERLLEESMYTRRSPLPDLLFRTSGENRLSDFLMWQISTTVLYFTRILWPQTTLWNFLAGIYTYQRAAHKIVYDENRHSCPKKCQTNMNHFFTERAQNFLERLNNYRKIILLKLYHDK